MTCRLCHGQGNLFCMQAGKPEWYMCPPCGGSGVRAQFGRPTIRVHRFTGQMRIQIEGEGK